MDYSRKDIYDHEIKDLVKQILLICDHHHIPVFMSFAVENSKEKTTYVNEMLSAAAEGLTLKDDKLVKHALVMDNFDVVPKVTIPVFEEEMEVIVDDEDP